MKKTLIYFLLITYLFTFSEVKQVLKLPNLIEHFVIHKTKNPDISIFAFIKMHYLNKQIKDSDYKDDMKLPFKTHDITLNIFSITTPPKSFEFSFDNKKCFTEKKKIYGYSEHFTTRNISSVFRPPILG